MYKTLIIALILVTIIIYLFLGNIRALVVPLIALPVSLISTFLSIYVFGFSINLFTLMALVLAIGIVVDDAIVMLENIVRRIELGDSPLIAAYKGARQVSFAIIATTVVLVAVFIPLIFIKGITGVLFTQTAITLASAVVISSFVALSLSPMIGSKVLKRNMNKSKIVVKFEKFLKNITSIYKQSLIKWIRKRKISKSCYFCIVFLNYPTKDINANLKMINSLAENFPNNIIGYSDHTLGIEVSIAAVALGAKIIEKHFTLDRKMSGPDHAASLEPDELKEMISCIRNIESALGSPNKYPTKSELKNIPVIRKSIVAKKKINKGEKFSSDNLDVKRPGNGLSPMLWDEIIGSISKYNFDIDEMIKYRKNTV